MIEVKETGQAGTYEVHLSGVVSDEDYSKILVPALESAIEAHEHIRVLVRLGEDFKDFTLGALFDDARMGLKHWRGFDRLAVVAEKGWITRFSRALSVLMPCPVRIFPLAETDDARRWLSESLGAIHQTDLGNGVLHVQLIGQLESDIYENETEDMNAFIRANDHFRLLLDVREFDGWQGLAAVGQHLKIVRDHYRLIDKAAIVGRASWQKLGERVMAQMVKGETRFFEADTFAAAKAWIAE